MGQPHLVWVRYVGNDLYAGVAEPGLIALFISRMPNSVDVPLMQRFSSQKSAFLQKRLDCRFLSPEALVHLHRILRSAPFENIFAERRCRCLVE